jgi:hypothetical protein
LLGQRLSDAFAQLLVDPFLNRDTKTLFRPIEDLGGDKVTNRVLKDVLGFEDRSTSETRESS